MNACLPNVFVTAKMNSFDSQSTILLKDWATLSQSIGVVEYLPGGLACLCNHC